MFNKYLNDNVSLFLLVQREALLSVRGETHWMINTVTAHQGFRVRPVQRTSMNAQRKTEDAHNAASTSSGAISVRVKLALSRNQNRQTVAPAMPDTYLPEARRPAAPVRQIHSMMAASYANPAQTTFGLRQLRRAAR